MVVTVGSRSSILLGTSGRGSDPGLLLLLFFNLIWLLLVLLIQDVLASPRAFACAVPTAWNALSPTHFMTPAISPFRPLIRGLLGPPTQPFFLLKESHFVIVCWMVCHLSPPLECEFVSVGPSQSHSQLYSRHHYLPVPNAH